LAACSVDGKGELLNAAVEKKDQRKDKKGEFNEIER